MGRQAPLVQAWAEIAFSDSEMTAETWATIEWLSAIYDFVIWWIIAPFVVVCIVLAILEALTRKE